MVRNFPYRNTQQVHSQNITIDQPFGGMKYVDSPLEDGHCALLQNVDITNSDTSNPAEIDLCRVCEAGLIDKSKVIFIKTADASVVSYLDALHTNGFSLINVEENAGTSRLGA